MTTTNANSMLLSLGLKDARHGTFTGLITTKVGVTRGRGSEKKVYGNDTVHTVIITGFDYPSLVKRSLDMLNGIKDEDVTLKGFTLDDVKAARAEMVESFKSTLDGTNEATTDHVYEPLTVDGEAVKGGRVYKCVADKGIKCHCRNCTGDAKAPLDGTIYLQGLRVWERVLTPAANGPAPEVNSAPKTLAKNALRSLLPIRRYVSYRLEPGTDFLLRAGGSAELEAVNGGFKVTPEIIDMVKRAA